MNKLLTTVSAFALTAILVAPFGTIAATAVTGNGAPSGAHYNLNIIGVPKAKTADMTGAGGNVIFVPLTGNAKIMLSEGATYQVLDKNGTDGKAAFQLPNPDPTNSGTSAYSVFARALGKPGGKSTMSTCADHVLAGLDGILGTADDTIETLCSVAVLNMERAKGASKFQNVSAELLYVYVDLDGDGVAERYNIFNDALQDYFWNYDNNGMKLLQLRFYPVPTTVPATM